MGPDRLSQALSLLGIAGYVYFLWFRPNQEGLALALGLFLQLFYGHPWAFLLGGLLGAGLPYALYRLRKPRR